MLFDGDAFLALGDTFPEANCTKTDVSPMWLTYFMVKWSDVKQVESELKCTDCGRPMKRTEPFTDGKGLSFEGYVCHADRRVTWLKVA